MKRMKCPAGCTQVKVGNETFYQYVEGGGWTPCKTCGGRGQVLGDADKPGDFRARAEAWLAGWRCGSAFLVIPDKYQQDQDFTNGWMAGREASKAAKVQVEQLYGVEFATLRAWLTASGGVV